MAFIILHMLVNACILTVLLISYKRKSKRLFCTAWVLYGVMHIYGSLSYIYLSGPRLPPVHPRDELARIIISCLQCLLGSLLLIASYSLYRGKDWSYHIIRIYCYIVGTLYVIFCPIAVIIMIYLIYASNAIIPGLQRLPGTCNLLISIGFIIYSIKFLNTIKPKIKEKTRKQKRSFEKEEIACPECGNIIPAERDICGKCNWTYADNKGMGVQSDN